MLPSLPPLKWQRVVLLTASGVVALFAVALFAAVYQGQAARGWLAGDFVEYHSFGSHFLATGNAYRPGSWYTLGGGDLPGPLRYPPPALYLFVAFQFIPWPLWWGIPLGVTLYIVGWWKPAMWSWPIIAAVTCMVAFSAPITAGNSDMWVMLVIALATRWPVCSWLLIMKPNQLVLTLPFVRSRGWWLGIPLAGLVSLPLLPLWIDWLADLTLYRGSNGDPAIYGLPAWPVMLIPLLARLASTRDRPLERFIRSHRMERALQGSRS